MTKRVTLTCDLCGTTTTLGPGARSSLDARDEWFGYLPSVDAEVHHCCSIACWLKNRTPKETT